MLYKKNNSEKLDMELWKNPTSEYRATPFWAWNCELDKDMLLRQIECFKEMGFGGFHIHSRSGMGTEYLGKEFMELVKACRDKAEEENMLTWLYDEDRWPSGSAGGYVTKERKFRQKRLVWYENREEHVPREQGIEEGKTYLLGVYDIILDSDGRLESYRLIGEHDIPKGKKRYAYVKTANDSGWFNGQAYVDTLSKEAMKKFIDVTYEAYKKSVGESFGSSVPAIFTDEPQFCEKKMLPFANGSENACVPWTDDFADTFKAIYGIDIIEHLPEIFLDLPDGKKSQVRYFYHDHSCERFVSAFMDQCGKWCDENEIAFTGHVMHEESLGGQTSWVGEAMRAYRSFTIPGIDMLCDAVELTTAKQTQSAVHQYGREAMLSELYGVTNWDYDFRGHKFQGDWQAALGVTVRVPHLSWVSMKGSAKRDYPASINYQAPWYKEYSYVEDHFARLNTVLTRGKPIVNVGVIHPIESYWINAGPSDTGSNVRKSLEDNFKNITEWLLTGMVDFDFISESLLPSQCGEISDKLSIGEMKYKTVIVPGLETIRRTTLDILKAFSRKGGRIVFVGECPNFVDASESDEVRELYDVSERVGFERVGLLGLLKAERTAEVLNRSGATLTNYVHALRADGDVKWFFLAHCRRNSKAKFDMNRVADTVEPDNMIIAFDGEYIPQVYDTVNAKIYTPDYEVKNGKTYIYKTVYEHDSLLVRLEKGNGKRLAEKKAENISAFYDFRHSVEYEREEDNVYILDMAEYSVDGGEFNEVEEIIRIDYKCRKLFGYPMADGCDSQPWVLGADKIEKYVTLRFKVNSTTDIDECFIAAEEAESITVNGREIDLVPCGYYVDESIKKYRAGGLVKGENMIEIIAPVGRRTSLENCFLLGNFDVFVRGCEQVIMPASKTIGFGDLARQGMPFYGGNIVYRVNVNTPDCKLCVRTSRYRGAAIKVYIDGKEAGNIAYAPYTLDIENVAGGEHTLEFKLFGSRVNTFDALHNCSSTTWFGPSIWYTFRDKNGENSYSPKWSYEYVLSETGILSSPLVQVVE